MARLMIMTEQKFERLVRARIDEFAKVQRRNYEQELLMKQANLSALQSQINPHFLYNTLECIRGQALMEDSPDIAAAAQALSLFFRYSISGKSDIVTLREELENLKNYVAIQSYRFKDRFSLRIDIEDADTVMDALIPKLTLQPIVENAVVHGFSSTVSGGLVTVTVRLVEPNISVVVSDNGKGMDEDTLMRLNRTIRRDGRKGFCWRERNGARPAKCGQAHQIPLWQRVRAQCAELPGVRDGCGTVFPVLADCALI